MSQLKVYLIPGQGADGRLFNDWQFNCETEVIEFIVPKKGELLPSYAARMATVIDTSRPFALVGVSLGGMVAIEIAKQLQPKGTVLIASAKVSKELPPMYRMMRYLHLHKLFPGRFYIQSTLWAQPIFEPMDPILRKFWAGMIKAKDPIFMKRAIHAIVNWQNEIVPRNVLHIHGSNDRTLPIKWVSPDIIIPGGSHVMTLTHSHKLSSLVNDYLRKFS